MFTIASTNRPVMFSTQLDADYYLDIDKILIRNRLYNDDTDTIQIL
jgi:hypothetical protein